MCGHEPPCPAAGAVDQEAARVTSSHPEQGWSLLCNGVVLFDDTGELVPDPAAQPCGIRIVAPHRGPARHRDDEPVPTARVPALAG